MDFGLGSTVMFALLALLTLGGGVSVILQRNPINSAVSLLFAFVGLSGLYILINAQLIALFQVMVYAGAILVLIVFTIMLLNLKDEGKPGLRLLHGPQRLAALLAGAALLVEVFFVLAGFKPRAASALPATFGDPSALAELLFSRYVFVFELASVLLLVAIVCAVVLARRWQADEPADQAKDEEAGHGR